GVKIPFFNKKMQKYRKKSAKVFLSLTIYNRGLWRGETKRKLNIFNKYLIKEIGKNGKSIKNAYLRGGLIKFICSPTLAKYKIS
ncbi:hypothetical protein N7931_17720, partial [Catenovulum sp. 2E275]|uniref:hypothetical protein n=1 Tax=Catenovulum sp. 2E275 TaxID=2980497 RepID=UPI0021D23C68